VVADAVPVSDKACRDDGEAYFVRRVHDPPDVAERVASPWRHHTTDRRLGRRVAGRRLLDEDDIAWLPARIDADRQVRRVRGLLSLLSPPERSCSTWSKRRG
jgi:hypothetical protein